MGPQFAISSAVLIDRVALGAVKTIQLIKAPENARGTSGRLDDAVVVRQERRTSASNDKRRVPSRETTARAATGAGHEQPPAMRPGDDGRERPLTPLCYIHRPNHT